MNLPQVVINALTHDDYSSGGADYSATTLISPPQLVALERRHGRRDDQDITDNLWSVFGTAVHNLMEQVAEEEAIVEKRIFTDKYGPTLSGAIDHYVDGTISDFKVTSAWKIVSKDYTSWEQQLNIYRRLYTLEDYPVKTLQIIAILRDWSKMRAMQSKDYPKSPIAVVPINMWTVEEADAFIQERIDLHEQTSEVEDEQLPSCSDKDRWYTGDKYAVMKGKNKRATKLCDSHEEATAYIDGKEGFSVVKREGESKRCDQYCPVAHMCHQWKGLKDEAK